MTVSSRPKMSCYVSSGMLNSTHSLTEGLLALSSTDSNSLSDDCNVVLVGNPVYVEIGKPWC